MKKILTYTILAACILALSACSHKPLDPPAPEIEVDETAPISFSTGVAGTKGLIENQAALDNGNTQIKVFDFMTATDGTTIVKYIEDAITGTNSGAWPYVSNNTYYWTKTGTHKFFGYLTQGPGGTSDTFVGTTTMSGQELAVGGTDTEDGKLELTPATEKQFDFLYSDIVSRTMNNSASDNHDPVALQMSHLFTALAVNVVNNTNIALTNLNVKFTGVYPTQSATIDWEEPDTEDDTLPTVEYQTPATTGEMDLGTLRSVAKPEEGVPTTPVPLYSGYALLWPQEILPATAATETQAAFAGSQVNISYDGSTARAANLSNLKDAGGNPITKFEAGKKYLLTITVKPLEVIFNIQVKPLDNMNAVEDNPEIFYVES